jgi:hypothetical protein
LALLGSDRDTQTHGYSFARATVGGRVGHRTPRLSHAGTGEKPASAALNNQHVVALLHDVPQTSACEITKATSLPAAY